jgi:hypothetical protein
MINYSDVYAATLAEFVSPIVPSDQGDAGKGQVNARAVYTINTTRNPNVGYITKSGGQTQYYGVAVDACLDKSDGTGADYLTDVDLGNGTREIRLAYTPYAPPPLGTPMPPANWQQPTPDMLEKGGPLTLKAAPGPDPTPTPEPPDDELLQALVDTLGRIESTLVAMQAQQAADTEAILASIQSNEDRFNQVVEDIEEAATDILLLLLLDRPAKKGKAAEQVAPLIARVHARIDKQQVRRDPMPLEAR